MKSKIVFYFILSVLSLVNSKYIFAADTNAISYFPLQIGNVYVYNVSITQSGQPPQSTIYRGSVIADTLLLNNRYFKLSGFPKYVTGWYRVDSLTGSLMKLDTTNNCPYYVSETFVDSLAALQCNNIKISGQTPIYTQFTCNTFDTLSIFSSLTLKKIFKYYFFFSSSQTTYNTHYAKNIGMYRYYSSGSYGFNFSISNSSLKGCVVNGVLYGDTTIPVNVIRKNFFPLAIGNRYIYLKTWSSLSGGGSKIETFIINADTIAYGKKYFRAENFPFIDNKWIRVDSITGSLYSFDRNNSCSFYDHEMIIDSLLAGLGDSTKNCLSFNSRSECSDTSYINLFGKLVQKKKFDVNCSVPPVSTCSSYRIYLDSIGLYRYSNASSGGGGSGVVSWVLRGGILNGTVFGDTSTVIGINNITSEVSDKYDLSQNYPNPFNPVTNIEFEIPKKSFVKLIIYDLLGSEMETLVSEDLSPGKYSSSWDASKYSSGVYYYKLVTDSYSESKKMVLIK